MSEAAAAAAASSSSPVVAGASIDEQRPPQKKAKTDASFLGRTSVTGHGTEAPPPAMVVAPSYGVSGNSCTGYGNVQEVSDFFPSYQNSGSQHQFLPPTPGSFAPGSAKANGALFYKTKLCTNFKIGACTYNERCHFAHGVEDLRRPPPRWESVSVGAVAGDTTGGSFTVQPRAKTRLCRYFADGKCTYGERCNFLHGNEDPQRMVGKGGAYGAAHTQTPAIVPAQPQGYGGVSMYPNGGDISRNMQYAYPNQDFAAPNAFANSYGVLAAANYSTGVVGPVATPSMAPYGNMPPTTSNVNPYYSSQEGTNGASANYNGTGTASNPASSYVQTYQTGNQGYQTESCMHNYAAGSYARVENEASIPQYPQEQPQQQPYSRSVPQNPQQNVMTHQGGNYY